MATKDEALKMAIEALDNACIKIEKWTKGGKWTAGKEALAKCKEALAQPAQEPVAWMVFDVYGNGEYVPNDNNRFFTLQTTVKQKPIPLYTNPAPSWQGLSLPDIEALYKQSDSISLYAFTQDVRAIEAKLKEKNHG